jgi:hypothetical protein
MLASSRARTTFRESPFRPSCPIVILVAGVSYEAVGT